MAQLIDLGTWYNNERQIFPALGVPYFGTFLVCVMLFSFDCLSCSVRTPISMKFFPRFFLLYFLVFHIYFFSYAYGTSLLLTLLVDGNVFLYLFLKTFLQTVAGFSYLALSTAAAFMQHLILYFWNRFEVTPLCRFFPFGPGLLYR